MSSIHPVMPPPRGAALSVVAAAAPVDRVDGAVQHARLDLSDLVPTALLSRARRLPTLCSSWHTATLLVLGLCGGVATTHAATEPPPSVTEALIVEHSNSFRRAHGRAPVAVDEQLRNTSREFARFMARQDAYGHEADGRTVAQRVLGAGYHHCVVAENIAWQYSSNEIQPADLARLFVDGWQQSPSHRHNLLDGDVTDIGVAVARSAATGRYYAVQVFARPASQSRRFRVSNEGAAPLQYRFDGRAYRLAPRATATHEHCRAGTLTLQPAGQDRPTIVQPTDGGHYRVGPDGASLLTGHLPGAGQHHVAGRVTPGSQLASAAGPVPADGLCRHRIRSPLNQVPTS
jgi:uncharacterized protein YkwD